ncbi:minor capsid protein [Aerococcaceae bacterium NML160702]|nr:minor capsid protein [Aerococcaceae bacterium NML160702]
MKQLDFMERLRDEVKKIVKDLPLGIGTLGERDSVAIVNMPGGEEVMYMSRKREKTYNISVLMKHKKDSECFNVLTAVYQHVENLQDLTSLNDSYEFVSALTVNLPSKQGYDEKGYQVWAVDFAINILIERGVV